MQKAQQEPCLQSSKNFCAWVLQHWLTQSLHLNLSQSFHCSRLIFAVLTTEHNLGKLLEGPKRKWPSSWWGSSVDSSCSSYCNRAPLRLYELGWHPARVWQIQSCQILNHPPRSLTAAGSATTLKAAPHECLGHHYCLKLTLLKNHGKMLLSSFFCVAETLNCLKCLNQTLSLNQGHQIVATWRTAFLWKVSSIKADFLMENKLHINVNNGFLILKMFSKSYCFSECLSLSISLSLPILSSSLSWYLFFAVPFDDFVSSLKSIS